MVDNSQQGSIEKAKQAEDIENWLAAASPLKIVRNHLDPHLTGRVDVDGFHFSDAIDYNEFSNQTPTHLWESAAASNTLWGKVWALLFRGGFKRVSQTTLDKSTQQVVIRGSKLLVDNAHYRPKWFIKISPNAQQLWYDIAEIDVQKKKVEQDIRIRTKDLADLAEANQEADAQDIQTEDTLKDTLQALNEKLSQLQTERDVKVSQISAYHFLE